MAPEETTSGVQLGLYVRSLVPRHGKDRQATVLDRLETLAGVGAIDDYSVTVCGRQVPASEDDVRTDVGASILGDIQTFREWARRNDLSLSGTFAERSVKSSIIDEHYRAISCPRLLLAEYHGQDLAFVAPVRDGSRTYTIDDRLDAIADGETATAFTPIERVKTEYDEPTTTPTP